MLPKQRVNIDFRHKLMIYGHTFEGIVFIEFLPEVNRFVLNTNLFIIIYFNLCTGSPPQSVAQSSPQQYKTDINIAKTVLKIL